jgi:hypothetical protein
MRICPFCFEQIHAQARKCKVCGEPLRLVGRALAFARKTVEVFSVFVALGSLGFAWAEFRRAEVATEKKEAAKAALNVLSEEMQPKEKEAIADRLNLKSVSIEKLEKDAHKSPKDQRTYYLAKTLKAPTKHK